MAAFLALAKAVSAGSTCPRPCAPILPNPQIAQAQSLQAKCRISRPC